MKYILNMALNEGGGWISPAEEPDEISFADFSHITIVEISDNPPPEPLTIRESIKREWDW